MKSMRIYAFIRRQRAPRGYLGYEDVHIQQLQERRWWGWKVLDEEIVPTDVKISMGCFGDAGGWQSKFIKFGSFGRDGILTPMIHN